MIAGEHLEHVEIPSGQALHEWPAEHHAQHAGVWLVTWKKHVPARHVTHELVLDGLVAFGWTDGIARRIDADRTRQLVSPRRTKPWAKSYKDRDGAQLEQTTRSVRSRSPRAGRPVGWDALGDHGPRAARGSSSTTLSP